MRFLGLKILIFSAAGLQIQPSGIVNPPERSLLILPRVSNFAESKTAEALIG
jgi:hypothetical protein